MVMLTVTKCEKDIRLGGFISTWEDRGRIQNDFGKLEKCLEISTRKFNTDKWKTQALEQQNQMPRHREVSNSLWVSTVGKEMTTKWIGANTIGWVVPKEENATLCCVHRMLDKLLVSCLWSIFTGNFSIKRHRLTAEKETWTDTQTVASKTARSISRGLEKQDWWKG